MFIFKESSDTNFTCTVPTTFRIILYYTIWLTRYGWTVIYPVDSVIHPLNNRGQILTLTEFLRTLEKCGYATPRASLCTSLMFLTIPACLYNSTMHSGAFWISLVKSKQISGSSAFRLGLNLYISNIVEILMIFPNY